MLQDITQTILSKALDGTALRHRAIAHNLANVETPNFKRQTVTFEDALKATLDDAREHAFIPATGDLGKDIQPRTVQDNESPARIDGNNVDVDREMAELAQNTLMHQASLQSLSIKHSMLRAAIYEGRR